MQDYITTDVGRSSTFLPVPLGELGEQLGLGEGTIVNGPSSAAADDGVSGSASDAAVVEPLKLYEADPKAEADLSTARFLPFLAGDARPCVTVSIGTPAL